MAALVLSRCCPDSTTLSSQLHGLPDCFRAILFTSAITSFRRWSWSLCLAQLTPAYGATSMPFHPGCRCPFSHSVFRRSVADACRGLPLCFLFLLISAFYFHVRSPSIVVASACHHSVRLHSPALRPVFYQLARTGFFVEGGVLETPAHLSSSGNHRRGVELP